MKRERPGWNFYVAALVLLVGLAMSAQGKIINLSEDPPFCNYYNGAYGVGPFPIASHSGGSMIKAYGGSMGYADVGAYWTQSATRMPGETWSFSGWVLSSSSFQMPPESYASFQIVFKTAGGDLIPFETRLYQTEMSSDTWRKMSVTGVEPPGATEVSFYVKLIRNNIVNNGGLYFDDNYAISPIPEPWVTGLIAVAVVAAGTGLERFRRKR